MIQNNATQINNFWFDVVMPVLGSPDWHLLTLFLYKQKLQMSHIEELMSESGINLVPCLKRLEDQGLVVKNGATYELELDDSKIKIKRKKARQAKVSIDFETIDTEAAQQVLSWQGFLRSVVMPHHIREILWRIYDATGRDKDNPWSNIPNINQWREEAKIAWDLSDQNMELIAKAILELTSKGYPISSPKSVHKAITFIKPKMEKKEENTASVGGWFQ